MSALFAHQSSALSQKIDSREGLLWCKKGVVCECGKMNFYLNCSPLTPVFRPFQQNGVRFAAKRSAFWCKMQCVLVQDGVRFGAKCKVKWYKMEGKMALNAR